MVPMRVWNDVFLTGHGFWTSLENVVVGPFIAFISFVCSIGNVPMAAALWHGGISFGGVISFIFADLIALPLVLIYRKYYGNRLALRLFITFYAVMAAAGLIVEGLFSLLGGIPKDRPETIVETRFQWNYTTFLNIAFLAVFAVLYWLYRNRERLGGGLGYATDPVCGMQVQTANAPAHIRPRGGDVLVLLRPVPGALRDRPGPLHVHTHRQTPLNPEEQQRHANPTGPCRAVGCACAADRRLRFRVR